MRNLEIHEENGVEFLTSPLLEKCGFVRHAFSTRRGGVSEGPYDSLNLGAAKGEDPVRVEENRRRFFEAAGLAPERVAEVCQVHGAEVIDANKIRDEGGVSADGVMTDLPGIAAAVQTADCVPVLLADPVKRGVAAVHAGRRGTAAGVLVSAVAGMKRRFGSEPKNLVAALGPGISGQCYEVGGECIPPFRLRYPGWRDFCVQVGGGHWLLDLPEAVRIQLVSAGVPEEAIDLAPHCTFSESARFFSYRRDGGPTGRLLSVIEII
ncbi:MAG TPA: peptidoglycan editing factor PgeF [Nitrospinae bacterium]|nr:peptidoglycan editing factor PgeF [Nitrospinota bacterium]